MNTITNINLIYPTIFTFILIGILGYLFCKTRQDTIKLKQNIKDKLNNDRK